jgi:sodium/potassium-transporting ATPase subunit alpha
MTGIFSLLLWFGGFLCFFGFAIQEDKEEDQSNLYLGIVLCLVTFVTGCFSFYQASSAASLMDDFKGFIPPKADVIRDGKKIEIGAETIAVGDLIELKAGKNIPADVVLITATEMKVNNASLTGESDDLLRIVKIENGLAVGDKKHENIFEADNAAFFGTQCTDGHGMGIVIKVGDSTIIGLIAGLTMVAETVETPLSIEIELFIKLIGAVALILGVTFFFFGVAYGYDYITNLVFAIGIIVANVPEGLLCTVTVSLALTAERMAKKNVLVKNLESVETLGSTSCICSDKTGTLTQNRMTVCNMFISGEPIDCQINYQTYKSDIKACGGNSEKEGKIPKPKYNILDPDF